MDQPINHSVNPSYQFQNYVLTAGVWVPTTSGTTFYGPYNRYQRIITPYPQTKTSQWSLRRTRPSVWVPPTNHMLEVIRRGDAVGSSLAQSGSIRNERNGVLQWGFNATALAITKSLYEAEALQTMIDRLSDRKVNLAVAFGERKQTANLLQTTATRITSVYRDLRRGNYSRAVRKLQRYMRRSGHDPKQALLGVGGSAVNLSKRASEALIELRYGWTPLLMDVYGSAEALAASDLGEPSRYRLTITGRKKASYSATSAITAAGVRTTRIIQQSYSCRYSCTYQLGGDGFIRPLAMLGVTDPLSVAWELTRASFVVDWCFNVGDWLGGFRAADGLNFFGGTFSELEKRTDGITLTKNGTTYLSYNAECVAKYVKYRRTVLSASPRPSLRFKNPFESWNRPVQNALALMRLELSRDTVHKRVR